MKVFNLSLVLLITLLGCAKKIYQGSNLETSKNIFQPAEQYYAALNLEDGGSLNRAARLVRWKRYKEAHDVLNTMLKKKRNVEGAYYFKGYVYFLEKKYDMAKFMYQKVEKVEKYELAIQNNLGVIAAIEGFADTAFYCFTQILEKSPYYFPALVNRGMLSLKSGLDRRAYEDLRRAVSINSKDSHVQIAFALSQRAIGSYNDAIDTLEMIEGKREVLYLIGLIYFEDLKDWKNAYKTFNKYLSNGSKFGKEDLSEIYLNRAEKKLSE